MSETKAEKKAEEKAEKRSLVDEFKDFIARGNVIELAVGLTVGTGFTTLVNSLVRDIIMPPIGLILNNVNFSELYFNLRPGEYYESLAAAEQAGAPVVKYGMFLTSVMNFLILAIAIFFLIKFANSLSKRGNILKIGRTDN